MVLVDEQGKNNDDEKQKDFFSQVKNHIKSCSHLLWINIGQNRQRNPPSESLGYLGG